jgi:O-antigen/teichoic acid export membrane protein
MKYWFSLRRFKEMSDYAGWNLLGGVATTLQGQGSAVLVNKYFGPMANAGYSVANSINVHCTTLAAAMRGAFIPALTTICGKGDYAKMRRMSMQACKFATLLSLIFMLPLAIELPTVIDLWLKSPPPHVVGLSWCMMLCSVLDYIGMGQSIAICAFGKVSKYQLAAGTSRLFMLPLAWIMLCIGCNIYAVGVAYIFVMLLYVIARAWLSRTLARLSVKEWLNAVVSPTLAVAVLSLCVGCVPQFFMSATLFRVLCTSACTAVVLVALSWRFVLLPAERDFLMARVEGLFMRRTSVVD